MTGPSSAGSERKAMALSSSDLGVRRSSTMRPTGTIMAPAAPWITRAATSSVRVCDAAQPAELKANRAMAARKTRCPPNRSAAQPLMGTNTAVASR
ncbi:hypothetical protein CDEF62S_05599 [Castellaniella defragrans]